MGIFVESIKKTPGNANIGTIAPKNNNNPEKDKSIFLEKENKSSTATNAVSIAATVLLIAAGICLAPKILKFFKNANIKKGLDTAKATKTAASAAAGVNKSAGISGKLSLDEKLSFIKERFNLTQEDITNPILRENAENLYEVIINRRKGLGINDFLTRKYTFSSEGAARLEKMDFNWCKKCRAQLKNYPVEVLEYAEKAEKNLPYVKSFKPEPNLGADKSYGVSIMDWYQSTFNNSGEVNNALRKSQTLGKKAGEVVAFFDSHQRPLGESTALIRGTDFLKDIKPGSIITDKAYMSCATQQGFIENIDDFAGEFVKHKSFLIIKTPANQKVIVPSDWTGMDGMGERILPRGTSLRVLEVHPLTDYGNNVGQNIIEGRNAIICEIV